MISISESESRVLVNSHVQVMTYNSNSPKLDLDKDGDLLSSSVPSMHEVHIMTDDNSSVIGTNRDLFFLVSNRYSTVEQDHRYSFGGISGQHIPDLKNLWSE